MMKEKKKIIFSFKFRFFFKEETLVEKRNMEIKWIAKGIHFNNKNEVDIKLNKINLCSSKKKVGEKKKTQVMTKF